jgi:C-terminal processing protease CtpA/Prc
MRRFAAWTTLILVLAAVPALAGTTKCPYPTQVCLNMMAEQMKSGGWLGVEIDTDRDTGYLVKKVVPDSPAQTAGIQPGDVLYALNGVVISKANKDKLTAARGDWKPGQAVKYTIKRDGADREVSLTLAPVPADVMARWIGEHMLEHAQIDVAKGTENKK